MYWVWDGVIDVFGELCLIVEFCEVVVVSYEGEMGFGFFVFCGVV